MFSNFADLIFRKFLLPLLSFLGWSFGLALVALLSLFLYYLIRYRINPLKLNRFKLVSMPIRFKVASFIRWVVVDMIDAPKRRHSFREFGLTLYCGRQGSGKTISMIHYLNRMKLMYPECIIVTNFDYAYADYRMISWRDFFDIRNGEKGVIFAIDEIHSEYSAASWKDFPESLLSEISQQRKQRVKIVATAQMFARVVKPIREQTFSVVTCFTLLGRWTFNKVYDARDYETYCESSQGKLKPYAKYSFIQSDKLRSCYDTYAKIERLRGLDFIPRIERAE